MSRSNGGHHIGLDALTLRQARDPQALAQKACQRNPAEKKTSKTKRHRNFEQPSTNWGGTWPIARHCAKFSRTNHFPTETSLREWNETARKLQGRGGNGNGNGNGKGKGNGAKTTTSALPDGATVSYFYMRAGARRTFFFLSPKMFTALLTVPVSSFLERVSTCATGPIF